MKLDLSLSNPKIMKAYLDEAYSQLEMEPDERIITGPTGGLMYCLFDPQDVNKFPREFKAENLGGFNSLRAYLSELNKYVTLAEGFAKQYGFHRVSAEKEGIIKINDESNIYTMGIGDPTIESGERIEGFLEMVKTTKSSLEKIYNEIMGLELLK